VNRPCSFPPRWPCWSLWGLPVCRPLDAFHRRAITGGLLHTLFSSSRPGLSPRSSKLLLSMVGICAPRRLVLTLGEPINLPVTVADNVYASGSITGPLTEPDGHVMAG